MEKTFSVTKWSLTKKIVFRFTSIYLVLCNLPFLFSLPLHFFPFIGLKSIWEKHDAVWQKIVPLVGKHVLHLSQDITIFTNGSGDTTYNYVQVLCWVLLAGFGAFIWALFDRKRDNYDYLYQWLRVYVRFSLASVMIIYGAAKVIKTQFPDPSLSILVEPFGNASPMDLLWAFMGFSEPYNIFIGIAEMLGGILLVAPQLTTLASLVCIGVMSNVFMLNMSYDVPVKMFSLHLLIMAVFLLTPDLKRLINLFILNNKTDGIVFPPLFQKLWLNRISYILGIVFIFTITVSSLWQTHQYSKEDSELKRKLPFYGIWVIDEFEIDGEVKPPLLTDKTQWRRVIFESPGKMLLQTIDEKNQYCDLLVNIVDKTLELHIKDENQSGKFSFEQPKPEIITLQGKLNDKASRIKLHRIDETKFLLNSRGFHWINEFPYSR